MLIEKQLKNVRGCLKLFIFLVLPALFFIFSVNAETIQQKKVLILHADNPMLPANIIMDKNFNTILKLTNPIPVALYGEYLELVRFNSEILEKKTIDLLNEKYSKLNLDLILITDDKSWDFMIDHGKDVFPEAPIVFCGITEGKIDTNSLKPNVTGNFKHLDIRSNFENILTVQPDTKEIFVIVGTSEQDAFYENIAYNAAVEYEKKVKITFVKGLSIEDTQKKISNLPTSKAVLYISLYKDGLSKTFNPRDALSLLSKTANVPIYGVSDTYLGNGIMGGNLLSFADFSKNAAEIALQVLNGKSPADILAIVSPNKNYFDFKEMQRWGIHEKNLPQGSIIINKQPGPWDLYRWQIIGTLSVGIIGLLLIVFLIFQIHLKKKAKAETLEVNHKLEKTNRILEKDIVERIQAIEKLRESEERHRSILQTAMDGIWLIDLEGHIIEANDTYCQMSGYSIKELLSLRVQDIEDIESQEETAAHIQKVMNHGKDRFESRHRRKDGSIYDVEVSVQYRPEGGKLVAFIQDITERKQIEEALRKKEITYSHILDSISDGFFALDNQLAVTFFNKAAEQILGKKSNEVIGHRLFEVFPEAKGSIFEEKYHLALQTKTALSFETYFDSPPYQNWYDVRVYPYHSGISVFFQLTTEKKKKDESLRESEEKFRILTLLAPAGIYLTDPEGNCLYTNPCWNEMAGFSSQEALGNGWVNALHPEDRETVFSNWGKMVESEGSWGMEYRFQTPEGKVTWVYGLATPQRDASDKIIRFVGLNMDITKRKHTEEALKEMAQRLKLATSSAGLGIWDWELTSNKMVWDDQMLELYGLTRETFPGGIEAWQNGLHPEDRDKTIEECQAALRGEKEWDTDFRVLHPDGTIKHIKANGMVIRNSAETPVRMLGVNFDITEQKWMEEQLQHAQKMEAIGTLAGGIAHDFNNILFPIIGYTEMLMEDFSEENSSIRNDLNQVYTGALRARDLVQQILAFARQEKNELKLMKMQPIIKEAMKLIRSTIPTTISITQNLQPDCGPVTADPIQIHQIVMNLATNAYHAMEENGGELKVTLKEIEMGEYDLITPDMSPGLYACLSFADTGMGMDKDVKDRIFNPFFTTKEQGKGTGMGLSVVHGIVKNMKGAIQVYSEPGKGTEFHVYLPVVGNFHLAFHGFQR